MDWYVKPRSTKDNLRCGCIFSSLVVVDDLLSDGIYDGGGGG